MSVQAARQPSTRPTEVARAAADPKRIQLYRQAANIESTYVQGSSKSAPTTPNALALPSAPMSPILSTLESQDEHLARKPVFLLTPDEKYIKSPGWKGSLRFVRHAGGATLTLRGPDGKYRADHTMFLSSLPIPHTITKDSEHPGFIGFLETQKVSFSNKGESQVRDCKPLYKFSDPRDCWNILELLRGRELRYCRPSKSVTSNLKPDPEEHRHAESRGMDIRIWLEALTGALSFTFLSHSQSPDQNYRYVEMRVQDFEESLQEAGAPANSVLLRRRRSSSVSSTTSVRRRRAGFSRRSSSTTETPSSTIEWLNIAFESAQDLEAFRREWATHHPTCAELPSTSALHELGSPWQYDWSSPSRSSSLQSQHTNSTGVDPLGLSL